MRLFNLNTKESAEQLSPAREKLKALLDQRAACEKRAQSLRMAQQRLVGPVQEAAKAQAELAAFDKENADAMTAWARRELKNGDRPEVDSVRRQDLIVAKAVASENAAAAQSASAQLGAEIHAEDLAAKGLQIPVEAAIAEILSESVDPLIEDLQKALRAVLEKQSRVKRALEAVINIARAAGPADTMKSTFDLAQALSERINTAAVPTVDNYAADLAVWTSLAARLRTDASAELEA